MDKNKLIVHESVPEWTFPWLDACKEIIAPEWEVRVEYRPLDDWDLEQSGAAAIAYRGEYLSGSIRLGSKLEDEDFSHYCIVHEFTHMILADYFQCAQLLVEMGGAGKSKSGYEEMKTVTDEMIRLADEATCTRIARTFYELIKDRVAPPPTATKGRARKKTK